MNGNLELVYAKNNTKTQLIHSLGKAPLKIQRPFYPAGEKICHSVVLHTAGGMVGGDTLRENIHLQKNAQVLITTAAAQKIYRSNGETAKQTIDIKIDEGANLEWLPTETIVFNGAIYQQKLRVELAPGGSWLGWEITRFGRTARGERFLAGEWRSHTEVWQQGKPLWIDPQWLPAGENMINSPHGLAGKAIVGSMIFIGKPVSQEIIDKARSIWDELPPKGEIGVTQTLGEGLLCRYRGASTAEVRNWFIAVWQLLRLSVFQYEIIKPRIWQI
ncbi:MAG: urease accessory protein UreD [Gomphosphaeria aponina SAG 52.96 = DSM 107014]|uniref:Urease accessory protein UreD n=1 Tax=Gomphosphaeria aponina SAG 52.96 = DSM 107014 TaxID=1521640 RepID=A0A941JVA1_9CHRO|nr:urease accessory protein UreD [Gomphosphaeria aponina SAG 52.96 = DSM 107014]